MKKAVLEVKVEKEDLKMLREKSIVLLIANGIIAKNHDALKELAK